MTEGLSMDPRKAVFNWNIDDDHYKDGITVFEDGRILLKVGGYYIGTSIRTAHSTLKGMSKEEYTKVALALPEVEGLLEYTDHKVECQFEADPVSGNCDCGYREAQANFQKLRDSLNGGERKMNCTDGKKDCMVKHESSPSEQEKPSGVYEAMELHALMTDPVCRELQRKLDQANKRAEACIDVIRQMVSATECDEKIEKWKESMRKWIQEAKDANRKLLTVNKRAEAYREVAIKYRTLWGELAEPIGVYSEMPVKVDEETKKLLRDEGTLEGKEGV